MCLNILVIGGTRLLGLALVRRLITNGHNVTVLSRHPERIPKEAVSIGLERLEGLAQLSGRTFDATVDFIAYDQASPKQVFNYFNPGVYILVSSIWIVRLAPFLFADQILHTVDAHCASLLPVVTYSYLIGKMGAEKTVLEMRNKKKSQATILRLPIFLGKDDHTGRLDFYSQRISDGAPIICVDGGINYAQIAHTEDLATVIAMWISRAAERTIWEAIPNGGTAVRDIIKLIGKATENSSHLIDIPSMKLSIDLPEYLINEPLWREIPLEVTKNNIFTAMKVSSTPASKWLPGLVKNVRMSKMSKLRKKEIVYLENNFKNARNSRIN